MSESGHDLIVERALLGSIAAMLPVPFVDDFLLRRSRYALFGAIAASTKLHLTKPVLAILVADPDASMLKTAGMGLLSRVVKLAALPARIASRAHTALQTFQLATLLDHYARRHHRGLDLDPTRAKTLRQAMDKAVVAASLKLRMLRDPRAYARALTDSFDEHWAAEP